MYDGNQTRCIADTDQITTMPHSQCLTHYSLYTPSERQSEEPSVTPAADCPTPRAHVLFHCSNRQALLQKLTMASRWQAAQTTRAPALKALNAAMRGLLALAAPHVKGGFTKVHFYSRGSSPSPSRSRVDRSVAMITRHPLAFRVSGTGPGSPHDHERCCHYKAHSHLLM